MNDPKRELLRHIVATAAYRGRNPLANAPANFGDFKIGESTKTPLQILSHMGDLYEWGLSQLAGDEKWTDSEVLSWGDEVKRFFRTLSEFDEYLASGKEIHVNLENLIQGPVADSLTHIGQIAMLRRLANSPVKGENFFKAKIEIGRVSEDQESPAIEFD